MSESNPVAESPASSTSSANSQLAVTPESERLADALGKLESAAPPNAYWYMDDRKGLFDRLVDWQARSKEAGVFADSPPLLANRMGVLMAGFAVIFVTIGAIYGMRSQINREFNTASADSLPSNVSSLPLPVRESQPPGVSLLVDPESESLLANAPTVSVTEFDDPFLGLAPHDTADLSQSALDPALPGTAANEVLESPGDTVASTEGTAVATSEEAVLIYAPPARERRMPARRAVRAREGEADSARQVSTSAPLTSVKSSRRARASESRERQSATDRDNERRIDRQAERAFQAEYRREFDKDRRNRNDWRPTPTSAVDPKNPNWGWD